jgi:putative pyruvate formate lyase activating enzyme
VDRTEDGFSGFCEETDILRVAYVGPHFGEEPPITGENGSGTVFLSGCSLKCSFCQNHQISRGGIGSVRTEDALFEEIVGMIRDHGVHNINFVTPDHFIPHLIGVITRLQREGFSIPVVFNLSGYQATGILRAVADCVDIYLPDYKYADSRLAARLSRCPDYPSTALDAISEMVRQKGFLDRGFEGEAPATRGVLVRHLILPGYVENSIQALTALFVEFGSGLPLSLMSQYHPVLPHKDPRLNRRVTGDEFKAVYDHVLDLGFERLFVQYPEESSEAPDHRPDFVPDFAHGDPFSKKNRDVDMGPER